MARVAVADSDRAMGAEGVAADIVAHLGLTEVRWHDPSWPLASSRALTMSTFARDGVTWVGFGHGEDSDAASVGAAFECAERVTQFDPACAPAPDAFGTWDDVCDARAIPPEFFGLYLPYQYQARAFPCVPFDPGESRAWTAVTDLADACMRLAPIEFVYPAVMPNGRALVRETSSGTAAHVDHSAATLAALCEVIERDALMLFWHREAPATLIPMEEHSPAAQVVRSALTGAGHVVIVLALRSMLDLPCHVAFGLSGDRVVHGSACDTDPCRATERALGEVGAALLHERMTAARETRQTGADWAPRTASEHARLYDGGPDHEVFRGMLSRAVRSGVSAAPPAFLQHGGSAREQLHALVAALRSNGLRVLARDITTPGLRACGAHVVRVLVPGLVPLSFGSDMLRLGCTRLTGTTAPGRLVSLLPHCFA